MQHKQFGSMCLLMNLWN